MDSRQAWNLVRKLMDEHQLQDWRFQFDTARRRAGCCKYSRKVITLSQHYVKMNSEEDVRDTILHEIAHAIAGWEAGHGPAWQAVCRRIGAKPERCYGEHVAMPKGNYIAPCPTCGKLFTKFRAPKLRPGAYSYCRPCGPLRKRLTFRYGIVEPKPVTKPTLHTLFE